MAVAISIWEIVPPATVVACIVPLSVNDMATFPLAAPTASKWMRMPVLLEIGIEQGAKGGVGSYAWMLARGQRWRAISEKSPTFAPTSMTVCGRAKDPIR